MFNLRRLLALTILVSVVIVTVAIYRNYQQRAPEEILKMLPENIDLALDNFHYTQNEDGRRRWTLAADKAEYQRKNMVANLENVTLQFYQAGDFGNIHLRADRGRLDQETSVVDLTGNVVITTDRGYKFFTEKVNYDDRKRLLMTDKAFRLVSPQLELTGVGMKIDVDKGDALVKSDVHMVLYPAGMEKQ